MVKLIIKQLISDTLSFKLQWYRAQELLLITIPMTTGGFELSTYYMQCSKLTHYLVD